MLEFSSQTKRLLVNYSDELELISTTIELSIAGTKLSLEMDLPKDKVSAMQMLPLFHVLTNFFTGISVKEAEQKEKTISCQKGCGACCAQLVPITLLEANFLKQSISDMPAAQRSKIENKFLEVNNKLHKANLLDKLQKSAKLDKDQRRNLGLEYFQHSIFCPFLENDSCSIHPFRPMACREYLVTSPINFCENPDKGTVEAIEMPRRISNAVARITSKNKKISSYPEWMPLITILNNTNTTSTNQKLYTGTEWLQKLFVQLSS